MSEPVSKLGRKEILTEELARKIARMVSLFPDSQIPVTWENVMTHSKKKFGHAFNRQMLSQKEWSGRKLIAEAFSEAKNIQRRMQNDIAPKYKTAARSVLQKKIGELEAKNLALREELEMVRAQQVDKLDVFLNTTSREIDLHKLLEMFYETKN
ncbi:TPA: hypothetical protein SIA27_001852 [Aeromonas salmonicida]|nr:hypothetical protein [Aeromonas salmonicida]